MKHAESPILSSLIAAARYSEEDLEDKSLIDSLVETWRVHKDFSKIIEAHGLANVIKELEPTDARARSELLQKCRYAPKEAAHIYCNDHLLAKYVFGKRRDSQKRMAKTKK